MIIMVSNHNNSTSCKFSELFCLYHGVCSFISRFFIFPIYMTQFLTGLRNIQLHLIMLGGEMREAGVELYILNATIAP